MSANTQSTQGVKLFYELASVKTEIDGLKSVSGFGSTRELEDITNLSSTAKEYRTKLPDGKEFTASIQYDPNNAGHKGLESASNSDQELIMILEKGTWQDALNADADTITEYRFNAIIVSIEHPMSEDTVQMLELGFKVTGPITVVDVPVV